MRALGAPRVIVDSIARKPGGGARPRFRLPLDRGVGRWRFLEIPAGLAPAGMVPPEAAVRVATGRSLVPVSISECVGVSCEIAADFERWFVRWSPAGVAPDLRDEPTSTGVATAGSVKCLQGIPEPADNYLLGAVPSVLELLDILAELAGAVAAHRWRNVASSALTS